MKKFLTGVFIQSRLLRAKAILLACAASIAFISGTASAQVGNAANGKAIYDGNQCANCHGSPPDSRARVAGNNPSVLTQAFLNINQMNVYRGVFSTSELNDLAVYLANPNITPLPTPQSISFPSVAPTPIARGSVAIAAPTATSGLPVTMAVTTPNICTQVGNTLTLWLSGTCKIAYDQIGGQVGATTYAPAPQAVQSIVITASAPVALSKRGGVDIEGNGKSAIVVRSVVGQTALLQAGRLAFGVLTFTPMIDPGANFRLSGITDFGGNGKSDMAIQNLVTPGEFGEIRTWTDFLSSTDARLRDVKRVWEVQAVGDLDGDGLGDLVWRYVAADPRDTGVSYIWFTNPSAGAEPEVRKRGGAPLDWTLLGAADINYDGAADMLYISPTKQIRMLMATPNRTCANLLVGDVPAGFEALKFADFTGGGRGDILMHNPTTGAVTLMSLNAAGYNLPVGVVTKDPNASCSSSSLVVATRSRTLTAATNPTWKFYASGDLDGDGIMDIVWLLPDNSLTVWLMNRNNNEPTVLNNVGAAPVGFTVFQP